MSYERLGQDNQNQNQDVRPSLDFTAEAQDAGDLPGTPTVTAPTWMTATEAAAAQRLLPALRSFGSDGFRAAGEESTAALERIGIVGPFALRALLESPLQVDGTLPRLVREYGIKALTDSVALFRYWLKPVQQFLNEVYPAAKIVADGRWTAKTEQYLRQYMARCVDLSGHPSPLDAILAAQDEYCAKPGVVCVSAPAGMSRNTKLALGLAAGVGLWLVFFRR